MAEITEGTASIQVRQASTLNMVEETYHKEIAIMGLNDILSSDPARNAKITVSYDLSAKTYGNGASVMCSVTINAEQAEEPMRRGFEIARAICEEEGAAAMVSAQEVHRRSVGDS